MFDLSHHPSWNGFFSNDILDILKNIYTQVDTFYPTEDKVLRFAKTDLDTVKCIIVGMEPYPSWNEKDNCPQATGRSFEVSEILGQTWDYPIKQASLRNILRALYYNKTGMVKPISEIREAIKTGDFIISDPEKWFDRTEEQGVLWLNSTLTVEPDKPGSHKMLWQTFRKKLYVYIAKRNIPFMLWGNNAVNEVGSLIPYEVIISNGQMCSMFKLQYHAPHPRVEAFIKNNTFGNISGINWYV